MAGHRVGMRWLHITASAYNYDLESDFEHRSEVTLSSRRKRVGSTAGALLLVSSISIWCLKRQQWLVVGNSFNTNIHLRGRHLRSASLAIGWGGARRFIGPAQSRALTTVKLDTNDRGRSRAKTYSDHFIGPCRFSEEQRSTQAAGNALRGNL